MNSGAEGCYELSVGNPDKGLLPLDEIKRRVQPFIDSETPLVVVQVCRFPLASPSYGARSPVVVARLRAGVAMCTRNAACSQDGERGAESGESD